MWKKAEKWKAQYGPLVYINVLGQGIVFINDQKVADDLLNRRTTIFGDRPRWIVASEIPSGGMDDGAIRSKRDLDKDEARDS